ncbi:MAG: carbohydrate binding family 9 domain-containing protein [Bacteroidales bacterium]|nr:carbohydrate binding family 9 domain-containing protein [Bacteroidales bacterium]
MYCPIRLNPSYSKRYFALIIILAFSNVAGILISAQSRSMNHETYRIHITRINEEIEIDGLLEENIWKFAAKAEKFQRVTPTDTGYATAQTSVMVAYDESNIYMAAICYDPSTGKRPVQSLRRDFSFFGNDNFAMFFDTFNDQTNGFAFYVSAAGAQGDQLIYNGSTPNANWNTKWRSAVMNYDDRWVVEYSIPFRSLRYSEGDTVWGINFGRFDLKTNEKSAWAPMPRQFNHCDLAYTGTLIWDEPLRKSGLRFSLIPYLSGKVTKNNLEDEDTKWGGGAGFDTKLMLSTSMNLDLTVNPDYSQVEQDVQVTNLDRFELFYPERRQFFLENSDLFASLGNASIRPLFSRRIGLNVPVNAGIRLSGNFSEKWRVGLMDMQTGKKDTIPAGNFAVAVLQRQVFSKSNISAFFINKQVTGNSGNTEFHGNDYNRVAGLEYNLASRDNRLTGKAFYHQSFYPGASTNAASAAGNISLSTQYLKAGLVTAWVGSDYIAEVGYIRRTGYFEVSPSLTYTFFPSSSSVISHGPGLVFDVLYDPSFRMTDRQTTFEYSIGFPGRSFITFDLSETFVVLDHPYDPTNTNGVKLPSGESFSWQSAGLGFISDSRKLFTWSLEGGYGSYFNGTRWSVDGSLSYKFQPYGSISVTADYNNIVLPDPYSKARLFLIGPKLDVTFTDKLFLTTFIQYNNQIENLNVNIRFQWRFAPVSDLFIVYTNNSYTGDFSSKNSGLAIKLQYWFN